MTRSDLTVENSFWLPSERRHTGSWLSSHPKLSILLSLVALLLVLLLVLLLALGVYDIVRAMLGRVMLASLSAAVLTAGVFSWIRLNSQMDAFDAEQTTTIHMLERSLAHEDKHG